MTKICIEVCIVSARGLSRSSSILKPQWFAVGWVDPNNKYCTKIDSSGSSNPTWKTKFFIASDDTALNLQGLKLTVEVYRRDPIFLRKKLQGTATIMLKEFLAKFNKENETMTSGVEEAGSFQLRKRNSSKPHGFVDVSVRIFEEREGLNSHSGTNEGYFHLDGKSEIQLAIEDGPVVAYPTRPQQTGSSQFGGYAQTTYPSGQPAPPRHLNYQNPVTTGTGYHQPRTPPPPPLPPSNAGFRPFPATSRPPETYMNLPASAPGPSQRTGPSGFGMGLGAGALAAGAVIFGDDFMSGPNFTTGFDGGSLTLSTDPPF